MQPGKAGQTRVPIASALRLATGGGGVWANLGARARSSSSSGRALKLVARAEAVADWRLRALPP